MLTYLLRHKLLLIMIVVTILVLPFSHYRMPESDRRAVITCVGIDKKDDNVEVNVNIIVPNSGGQGSSGGVSGTVKTMSAVGNNLSSAFQTLTLIMGKNIGLAHCDSIILNKQLFEEDILEYLDFFVRTNNLTSNASLIVAEDNAKDIVTVAAKQEGLRAISISNVLLLNGEYALTKNTNIDSFYTSYFSNNPSIILPILTTGDSENSDEITGMLDESSGNNNQNTQQGSESQSSGGSDNSQSSGSEDQSSSGSESGGGQSGNSGGSGNSKNTIIKNEGKGLVVKSGKIVGIVESENMRAINLIRDTKKGHIQVKGVNNNLFKDANLNFNIFNKKVKNTGFISNNIPIFNIDLNLILRLEEVVLEKYNEDNMIAIKNYVKSDVLDLIKNQVNSDLSSLINYSKTNNVDLLKVADYFNKYHHKEWKNFLDSLDDKENYLDHIIFTCDIDAQGKV